MSTDIRNLDTRHGFGGRFEGSLMELRCLSKSIVGRSLDDAAYILLTLFSRSKIDMGQTNLGVFLFFSYILKVSYGIFWFYIIPKWLINDS